MPKMPHIARYLQGNRSYVSDYPAPADAAATPIRVGDFVRYDLATDRIVRVADAADPTNLLGIAKSHNDLAAREEAVDATRILVEHFSDDSVVWLDGTRAPLATDKGELYGLALVGGVYVVDPASLNDRVYILDVDLGRNAYFCLVLAAHRQSLVGA